MTRLVLTNAIYFQGQWATPFNASLTQNAAFTLGSGGQVQVATMHATNSYRYMQSDGYQVLELPYAGNRLVMDVLLPSAGSGSAGLAATQLPANLNGWLQGLTSQPVAVSLPKFQITTPSFDLTQSLKALGMTDAFSPTAADFAGISANPLNISSVYHKAFVDVNETGTEAAAATGTVVTAQVIVSSPETVAFNANHPFLFLIRDTQSGSVLFMGQVADPSSTGTDPSAPAVPTAIAPRITSTAPTRANVGRVYAYRVLTNAASGQSITFSLKSAPAGMSINASTGLVIWSPTAFQTGSSAVTVLATDQFGDTMRQAFSIRVSGDSVLSNPFASVSQNLPTLDSLRHAGLKSNAVDQFFASSGLGPAEE